METHAKELEDAAPAIASQVPSQPAPTAFARVLALQRAVGNQAVARLLQREPLPGMQLPGAPDASPPPAADPAPAEYASLETIRGLFEDKTLEGYRELRSFFLAAFGADADGPDVAIERALAYYGAMVPATFMGMVAITVHPAMQEALLNAEAALAGKPYPLRTIHGVSIRFVRGSDGKMSNHSWGAAVDINGGTSPMTTDLRRTSSPRAQLILAVTGTDVTKDAEGKPISNVPKSQVDMTLEAARLQAASDALVEAFSDWKNVSATAFRIASERGAPTGRPDELYALLISRGDEAEVRKAVRDFVFPIGDGEVSRDWDPALMETTVDVLQAIGQIWDEIEERGRDDIPTQADFPDDVTLAVHGFESIPPEVVGALAGEEGGNLSWLGANEGGTKDYMHFDLRDIPPRY